MKGPGESTSLMQGLNCMDTFLQEHRKHKEGSSVTPANVTFRDKMPPIERSTTFTTIEEYKRNKFLERQQKTQPPLYSKKMASVYDAYPLPCIDMPPGGNKGLWNSSSNVRARGKTKGSLRYGKIQSHILPSPAPGLEFTKWSYMHTLQHMGGI